MPSIRSFQKLVLIVGVVLPLYAQSDNSNSVLQAHAKAAIEAETQNDFATAIAHYEALTRALPASAEMQSNLGVALYFHHDYERSIRIFKRAMSMNSELLAPHLFSGLALYQLSQPAAAERELAEASRLNPSDVMVHLWHGYALAAQGEYAAAAEEFRTTCSLDAMNIDAWYSLGQSYLQVGQKAARDLLTLAPDGGRVWELAGEQLEMRGSRQEATQAYLSAVARRPDLDEIKQKLAHLGVEKAPSESSKTEKIAGEDELYLQARDAETQSQAAYEHVVSIAPESYRAHQILADSMLAQGRTDDAILEYQEVLRQKPETEGVHAAIGKIDQRNDRLPEALEQFKKEIALHPRSASANVNAASVMLLAGDEAGAQKLLEFALTLDHPPIEAYLLRGKLELRRSQPAAAAASLQKYISTVGDNSDAYYLLARAYRGTGNTAGMENALAKYKETSQDAKRRSLAQKEIAAMRERDAGGDSERRP